MVDGPQVFGNTIHTANRYEVMRDASAFTVFAKGPLASEYQCESATPAL